MWQYDDIAILTQVAEAGSFSAAAKQLSMPTSTVSRRIQQLENTLNLRLIERSSRKMSLTEQGKFLVDGCSSSIRQIRENVDSVIQKLRSGEGSLRITAPVFLAVEVLGKWIAEYASQNPNVNINLRLSNDFENLIEENFDLAFRLGPLSDSEFIAQFLHKCRYQLCGSPEYLRDSGSPASLSELKSRKFLLLDKTFNLTAKDESDFHLNFRELTTVFASNDISVLRDACLAGLGIATLPNFATKHYIEDGKLIEVLPTCRVEPVRDIYAVYPSRRHLAPQTRKLIEFIQQKYRDVS